MKVGILCPRSNAHAGMMMDFMNGIKTSLKQQQLKDDIQLISESIGFGGNEKEVYEKAEKLLVLNDADVLIAYIDLRILEILKPLLYACAKPALIINPGANYQHASVPQPNILSLTLQHGFLCWLSGKLAANSGKTDAVVAATFYDCGYLHTAAIVNGFVKSGGRVMFNYINKERYDETFEIKQLTDYLSFDKNTKTLLCVFDSLPASLLYSRLNNYNDAADLHLYVSPMMLENDTLKETQDGSKFTIEGYVPWHPLLENRMNQEFMTNCVQETKRAANVFSLLGWETGLILQEIFLNSGGNYLNGEEVHDRLAKAKINSPRGEMTLDAETNYFVSPAFKCSLKKNSTDLKIEQVTNQEKEWEDFISYPVEGTSSGWTNTYLCY